MSAQEYQPGNVWADFGGSMSLPEAIAHAKRTGHTTAIMEYLSDNDPVWSAGEDAAADAEERGDHLAAEMLLDWCGHYIRLLCSGEETPDHAPTALEVAQAISQHEAATGRMNHLAKAATPPPMAPPAPRSPAPKPTTKRRKRCDDPGQPTLF